MKTRSERLMDMMLSEFPFIVLNSDTCQEYIEQGGQVECTEFSDWLEVNGYWREYYA